MKDIEKIPSAPCECGEKSCTKRLYDPADIREFVAALNQKRDAELLVELSKYKCGKHRKIVALLKKQAE